MRITTSSSIINRLGVQSTGCNTPSGLSIMGLLCYMRIIMSNPTKELNGKTYLQCKQCDQYKQLGKECWYKHNEWYLWVLWRCKECIKEWRKTDKELTMARKRDIDRYYNNPKRRDYIYKSSRERRKEKWYEKIHSACYRRIKSLWIRPEHCPICNSIGKRIEAHHHNYMKPRCIIFCCKICHSKLDRWIIDYKQCDIIDIEPKHYKSKLEWIDHKINKTWSCF